MDAAVGWFADPVYLGKYPDSMRERLGDRLPEFTAEEAALLKGSSDVSSEGARSDAERSSLSPQSLTPVLRL